MADNVGRRTTGMVSSSPAPPGPLPSPGTSRRNSPSDEKFVRAPSTQHIHQPPPPPQSALPALPVTAPGFVPPPLAHYRHQPPPPQQGSNAQFLRAPVPMPASSAPASHPPSHGHSAHPSAQQSQLQAPPGRAIVFPSPRTNGAPLCTTQQYENLMHLVRQTEPHVVRQVIRDSHETSLLGSEYHHVFLLNTAIHKAQASSLSQAISDYGSRLVQTSKRQLLAHFTANDLDEVADDILGKVSNDFLDRALAKRLETIRARSLVNILAKAERLGYNVKDIVEETRGGAEHVIPYLQQDLAQRPLQHEQQQQQQQQHQQQKQQPSVLPVQAEPVRSAPSMTMPKDENLVSRFQRCSDCYRPLSGPQALHYHRLKKACNNFKTLDRVGKDLCAHCGAEFTSSGGLSYHVKSQVCGAYTESHVKIIMPALEQFYRERAPAPAPSTQAGGLSRLAQRPGQDLQPVNVSITPMATSHASTPAGKKGDPFGHLAPEKRTQLETELARAEAHYGTLMQKAMELASPAREDELAKLKNSFNTKQCMTRKRYGVRLRERRTKAELEAEHQRLFMNGEAKQHVRFQPPVTTHPPVATHPPVTAHPPAATRPPVATHPPVTTRPEPVPAAKRARINEEGDSAPTSQPNILNPPDHSPRKRVALAEMGGLGTSAATAEHTDPTAVALSHPQSVNTSDHKAAERSTNTRQSQAPIDPMDIGDSDSSDTDSEEDEGDIPAVVERGGQK